MSASLSTFIGQYKERISAVFLLGLAVASILKRYELDLKLKVLEKLCPDGEVVAKVIEAFAPLLTSKLPDSFILYKPN